MRIAMTCALAVALAAGCTGTPSGGPPTEQPTDRSSGSQSSVGPPRALAEELKVPWGVTFLPDRSALVSERDSHRILRVTEDGEHTEVGRIDGVGDDTLEGGLLGLAASPSFADDHRVFAYITTADDNRVISFRFTDGRVSDQRPVFTGIPKAGNHNGGRIAFGPDRMLYVTTGDAMEPDRAQDEDFLGGKILRMTQEGEPAPGNPFDGSVVYSIGHRNPQGLAWSPDGTLYEAEFGENRLDELNLLRPGRNYGWPDVEGTIGPARERHTRPLVTWKTGEASPSGLAYSDGALWLATLQGENVYRMRMSDDGTVSKPEALYDERWGRLRTIIPAPDGSLWLTTSNKDDRGNPSPTDDRILRIPPR